MEISILNVDPDVNLAKLREALATRLHRPPFRRQYHDPKINFDVYIHRNEDEGRTEWEAHRGIASFTLPYKDQGYLFLKSYGEAEGFPLMGKKLHFSQATRKPAEGLVESLRRLPWLEPEERRKRDELLRKLDASIAVRQIDFGRPCRDGVFSVEHVVDFGYNYARLSFDAEFLLVRITTTTSIMTFRCDVVEGLVADEKANAILVTLKMAPSFEEVAKMHGDPQDVLDGRVQASAIPEQMPPPTRPTHPVQKAAPQPQKPRVIPDVQPKVKAPKPNKPGSARYIPGMPKPPSPSNSRQVPGLHKLAPVPKEISGWGDEAENAAKHPPKPSQHPLAADRPVVPGLPSFNPRPPPEQTAYARAAGGSRNLDPESETSWPIGITPRYVGGKSPSPGPSAPQMARNVSSSSSGGLQASGSSTTLDLTSDTSPGEDEEDMTVGDEDKDGPDWRTQAIPPRLVKGLRQRVARFDEKHKNTAPFTSKTFRLVFGQADAILDFEEHAELTWTGFPVAARERVPVEARHLYSHKNRSKILMWLKTLPLTLGMQLDGLFLNGVLDPLEMLSLQKPVDKYLQTMKSETLAHAVMILGENVAQEDGLAGLWRAKLNIAELLESAVERVRNEKSILPIHAYMVKTFHLYITPSSMILEGPYPSETNRIVRRYKERIDSFLRVTFCDESKKEYRWERNLDWPTFLKQRVGKVLLDGVTVAGRNFSFLGYSMSSLRMRSAWFMTPFSLNGNEITAERIRQDLGDFSKVINAPSRYGARIAQAFTATRPSLHLRPEQIIRVPDIMDDNGHCFTDGAAVLSRDLAREILKKVGDAFGPSPYDEAYAFQFRLGGAKGVAAIDTRLEGSVLHLRPSTEKFDAPTSLDFEVVAVIWQCRPLTLNQDIIQILEDRGVKSETFLRLQSDAMEEAKLKRLSLTGAAGLLENNEFGEAFDVPVLLQRLSRLLTDDEFDSFAQECQGGGEFLQRCVRNAFANVCRNLKYKARLPVPRGYLVVGTADETRSLGEREVYCCVTPFAGFPLYFKGKVLVYRSPAVHPGDAQVLHAIGEPPAEHKAFFEARRNQIVFSTKGTRPLASELGGGDLDGDPFGITDYADLFPPEDADPAEYPTVIPMRLDRPAKWEDVVDWVVTYIGSDVLGLLGNRRRICADQARSGTKHPKSLLLAELYTAAVDAPKSGILPPLHEIPKRLFPLSPDFTQKEDLDQASRDSWELRKFYESDKALGKLYRAIPRTITNKEPWIAPILPSEEDGTDPDDGDFAVDEPVTNALRLAMVSAGLPCAEPTVDDLAVAGRLQARFALELRHVSLANSLISHAGRGLSEAELVMGLIAGPTTATGGRQRDVVEKATTQAADLVRAIRKQLVEPRLVKMPPLARPTVPDESSAISGQQPMTTAAAHDLEVDGEDMPAKERFEYQDDQGRRAWAAWCVATRAPPDKFGVRSFGLVALGAVMDAVESANKAKKEQAVSQFQQQVHAEAAAQEKRKGKQRAVEVDFFEDETPETLHEETVDEDDFDVYDA